MDRIPFIQVGTTISLSTKCLGNDTGTVGVCYQVYTMGNNYEGYSFIFPNGRYDGFSPKEVKSLMDMDSNGFCPELGDYRFSNVMNLYNDFKAGRFDIAFEEN